jgi:hypothetical protein
MREAHVAMIATREAASLPRLELGNTSMVTADRAHSASRIAAACGVAAAGARAVCRSALLGMPSRVIGCVRRPDRAPKLLTLIAISCAMAIAGCASNAPPPSERPAEPVQAAAPVYERPEPRIRRPARALLLPQPAPDCEFKRNDLKTVDPDQWARLKLDYERQCYKRAEKMARDRLRRLQQASNSCQIEPVRLSLAR